jgi:hypothetical protein
LVAVGLLCAAVPVGAKEAEETSAKVERRADAEETSGQVERPVASWGKTTIFAGTRYASRDFGVAIGGGAGYTLSQGIYLGNQADYYFGRTIFSGWSVLLEGGYDFGLGQSLMLRPVIGAGAKNVKANGCKDDSCKRTNFAFGLGLGLYWFLTSWLNLGLDGRVVFSDGTFTIAGLHLGVAY